MADHATALALLLKHGGGYVNDPVDRGGKRYRSAARRFHADWAGWKRIDSLRGKPGFPGFGQHLAEADGGVPSQELSGTGARGETERRCAGSGAARYGGQHGCASCGTFFRRHRICSTATRRTMTIWWRTVGWVRRASPP
ncbi:MAG: hypothetical protein DWQ09_16280 [Proteobacteria bacterium]|nr:MAG: hypothetical protein DWQ09_16280 [Pseudomonadota bacterium]QKK11734.1 MAG: hypothetical protein HND59_09165 [Pseudomonadota bacterium]